MLPRLLLII